MKKLFSELDILVSAAFMTVTVVIVIVNVLLRYLFQEGFYWVEEVATTSFIWSVFIGAAAAYRKNMHVGIDLVAKVFPGKSKDFIYMIVTMLMVVINGYIVYLSTLFIQANSLKRTPVLDVPAIYVNSAITVGFSLVTIYAFVYSVRKAKLLFSADNSQP